MAAMEKRGLHPAPGTFKEVEGITADRFRDIVGYMDGTKSTLLGLKKIMKDVEKAQMWSWHILHPEAVCPWACEQHRRYVLVRQGFVFE